MSQTDQIRKGMVIRHEGMLLTVEDFNIARTGKQKATVHVKLRALKDGDSVERTLDQLGRIEEVPTERRAMQYLYAAGDEHVFMASATRRATAPRPAIRSPPKRAGRRRSKRARRETRA